MNNNSQDSMRDKVMKAITARSVHMKSRTHFALLSIFAITGILLAVVALLYCASLFIFVLRESGVWFAPSFGARGWWIFMRSLPLLLTALLVVFVIVLEILIRRYAFIYRKPLIASFVAIVVITSAGGFIVAQTSFHRRMAYLARHHGLFPPFDTPYRHSFFITHPPETYAGTITAIASSSITITDTDDDQSFVVQISPRTRLPYGDDFHIGSVVVVVGDREATGTVRAFGIREIDSLR